MFSYWIPNLYVFRSHLYREVIALPFNSLNNRESGTAEHSKQHTNKYIEIQYKFIIVRGRRWFHCDSFDAIPLFNIIAHLCVRNIVYSKWIVAFVATRAEGCQRLRDVEPSIQHFSQRQSLHPAPFVPPIRPNIHPSIRPSIHPQSADRPSRFIHRTCVPRRSPANECTWCARPHRDSIDKTIVQTWCARAHAPATILYSRRSNVIRANVRSMLGAKRCGRKMREDNLHFMQIVINM